MRLRWLPNAITIGRMVLALPLLGALGTQRYGLAFWLVLVAGVSDVVDGWLAKRHDWRTESGGLLDPLADKLLLTVSFLGLWLGGQLPTWFVALVIGRDVVIVAGALVWWRVLGPFEPAPSRLSKLNTLLQLGVVAAVLVHAAIRPLSLTTLEALVLASSALTVASGLDYVIRYGTRFGRALRNRP
jgi:cardiolipin synthase (CMP-forming)